MNYGEELTYWYLRLNGFFPITNFVLHRSSDIAYSSDVDVIAIRPPYVFEEIGGQSDDWDKYLMDNLGFERTLGLICEVKTGAYNEGDLFRAAHLRYTLRRLGLVSEDNLMTVAEKLVKHAVVEVPSGVVAKLFLSQEDHSGNYLYRTITQMEDFLFDRIRRYPIKKYGDRMFFPSVYLQAIIDRVYRERGKV